jgi:hypothetical protein
MKQATDPSSQSKRHLNLYHDRHWLAVLEARKEPPSSQGRYR